MDNRFVYNMLQHFAEMGMKPAFHPSVQYMKRFFASHRARWALLMGLVAGPLLGSFAEETPQEPHVTVLLPKDRAVAEEPYGFEIQAQWAGKPDAFVLWPAVIDAFDWGTSRVASMKASCSGEECTITEYIEITPAKTGDFELAKIRIPYASKPESKEGDEQEASNTRTETPATVLLVEPVKLRVVAERAISSPVFGGVAAGCFIAAAAGVAAFLVLRKRRKTAEPEISPREQLQTSVHNARRKRLDGDYYGFYIELGRTMALLSGLTGDDEDRKLADKLNALAQETGYRGARPNDDMMDGDIKDVERAIKRWLERPDTAQA